MSDLDLHIDRGMPEGEEIVFEGEADESPDLEAGDVVVRVRSKKIKGGFVRKDSNLYWKEPISVAEVRLRRLEPIWSYTDWDVYCADLQTEGLETQALLGFRHTVKGLDGHDIVLSRTGVTQPGQLSSLSPAVSPRNVSCSPPALTCNRLRRCGLRRRHADLSLDRTRQPFRRVSSCNAAVPDPKTTRRCVHP